VEIQAKLIELLAYAHDEVQAFVASLTKDERAAVGTRESWATKDTFAHLAEWQARFAEQLAASLRGETTPTYDDIDEANAEIFASYQGQSWDDVMGRFERGRRELLAHIQSFTEDDLASTQKFPWQNGQPLWRRIVGTVYIHPVLHLSPLYHERGKLDDVCRLQETMAEKLALFSDAPDWQGTVTYNLACHYALIGEKDQALTTLDKALHLNPGLAEWSKQDSDLASLHDDPKYQSLVEAALGVQE